MSLRKGHEMNRPDAWRSIMDTVVDRRAFRVGAATVDPVSRDARWATGNERLQPQTLKVLQSLLSHRGEVVTRDQLVQLCWDGRIVGDDVINRSISLLRHFAERAGGFEIETVPRAGYRLVETGAVARVEQRRKVVAVSAVAALLVFGVIALQLRSHSSPQPAPPLSIALLPFAADSSDSQTVKLASATHEAVAATLSQGAYAVSTVNAAPSGPTGTADFQISAQVTGTNDAIVVAVRMEEMAHHVVVFTHQFTEQRAKADDLPERVGAQVASQVSWTAPLLSIERRHPSDPRIIASLLQASAAGLNGSGALHDYENARPLADKDPNSPLAQTDLAFYTAFALDQIPRDQRADAIGSARAAADRALKLAPEFGDTHVPWCLLHSEQRMVECEGRLRAGMKADPDSPFANWFLANLILNPVGRNDEALELARTALAHDPYMPAKLSLMLRLLEATGHQAEATELYRRSKRWWPDVGFLKKAMEAGIVQRGDFQLLLHFVRAEDSKNAGVTAVAVASQSLPALRTACSAPRDLAVPICMLALARLGEADSGFALADRLYPSRRGKTWDDDDRIWINDPDTSDFALLTSAAAAPLRNDPRFLPLAERVGLLDYWRSGRLPDFCTKAHEPVCSRIVAKRI